MRDLKPYWYTTPTGEEFHLKPLDLWQKWEIQVGMIGRQAPGMPELAPILRACVLDWRNVTEGGEPLPFSAEKRDEATSRAGDDAWILRWMSIASELLRRSEPSEDETKKS